MRTASLSPLWGGRGVGFPLRGRGPYAAGREVNSRGDKFRRHERGVEQDLITGYGGHLFVAGILSLPRFRGHLVYAASAPSRKAFSVSFGVL